MFTPSSLSGADFGAAAPRADATKLYGIDRLDEGALRAAAKAAKARMWKTKILTPERVRHEKRANTLFAAADTAKRAAAANLGKDPPKLWSSDPKHRLVNFAGFFSSLTGVPSDAILAIAGGAQPGPAMLEGEYRKSILGGLLALQSAGVAGVQTKGLKAPIVGSREGNAALAKAAGMAGKPLADVYGAVKTRVAKYGPGMAALAWSYRAQLWIADVKGIEGVHAMSGAVVSLFVPIGTIVGAAIGGHSAITMALAKSLALKAEAAMRKALPIAKAEVAKQTGAASSAHHTRTDGAAGAAASSGGASLLLPIAAAAALLLGVGYVATSGES